jgi:hypothetical protein
MRFFSYILILLWCQSCHSDFDSEKELYKWMADEKNGLVKSKDMGRVIFKIKYLPPEYVAFNEIKNKKNYSKATVDSLVNEFSKTKNFLMTFEFKDKSTGDNVLMNGTENYNEYKERIEKLNFGLDEYLSMNTDKGEFIPLLWTLENTYTLGDKRSLYIVFGDNKSESVLLNAPELDLVFNDEIFYTGISHFVFKKDQLDAVPKINFWKF